MNICICACCQAMSYEGPPHGAGVACPTQLLLLEAEIAERAARKELLIAQRDATMAKPPAQRPR